MYTFLLVILILDALVLVAAVLMQSAKGGGLASSFGGVTTAADAFIGTRQAGHFLSKLTWWTGGIFLALSFILQLMSTSGTGTPRSILDAPLTQTPSTAPAPAPGNAPSSAVPLQPQNQTPPPAGEKKNP